MKGLRHGTGQHHDVPVLSRDLSLGDLPLGGPFPADAVITR
jgi:hypothetical protein